MTTSTPPSSRRRWPWLLALLLLAGLGGFFALKQAFPPARIAALLGEQVSSATGREFSIRGGISWRVLPHIAVVVEDVRLANLPWGTRPDMVSLRKAALELALLPLLRGRIEVRQISIEGADIWLEVDDQGRGNWAFQASTKAQPTGAADAPAGGAAPALSLAHLQWLDSRVTLHSPRVARDHQLQIKALNLRAKGGDFALDGNLDLAGLPLKVDGIFGGLSVLQSDAWPVDISVNSDGLKLGAKGQVSLGAHAGDLVLDLHAELQNPQALERLLDKPAGFFNALPLPARLSAKLQRSQARLAVKPFNLNLAGQQLEGELIEQGGQPLTLNLKLNAESLDLGAWLPKKPPADKMPAATPGPLLSRQAWPLPKELPLNLTLSLNVSKLLLPALPEISGLQAQLNLAPQQLSLARAQWGMAGGRLNGSARLDLAGPEQPARWQLKLDGKDLAVDGLGALLGAAPVKGGRLRLALDLAAQGDSAHGLAASLDGQLLVDARDLTLQGRAHVLSTDLLAGTLHALTPGAAPNQDNRIRCAVLRLPFKRGLAEIDRSVALETEQFSVAVLGRLDLGQETISVALRPFTQKGLGVSAANLSGLAKLEGPLTKPRLSLDVAGSAREATQLGLKVATGGLSVLAQRALLKPEPGEQPCQRALKPIASSSSSKSVLNSLFGH